MSKVTIMISKEEIIGKDVSRIRGILDDFLPNLVGKNRNCVTILINGYEDDPRELVLIQEVREWFHCLFDAVPEIFFWMDLHQPYLTFYAIMFGAPVRENGGTTVSADNLRNFMIWGYTNLNVFCEKNKISPAPSNEHIRQCLAEM